MEFASRCLFKIEELKASLAAVEAEREAARAEAARIETQLQAMLIQHRHDIRDLGQLLQDERCKVAVVKAGYHAARAREARAVEALRKLANEADALQIEEYSIRELVGNTNWSCLRLRIHEARALDAQPALDWLAQQRREAAAEVVNALADGCERAKRPILAQELRGHVAALLAGADALERLEAMESTSSTMLPKSASVSEAGE